jgi:hypothetical protein
MIPLWWGVTAGFYGGNFRSWQYIITGVLAFVMLIGVTVAVARMRSSAAGYSAATNLTSAASKASAASSIG